MALIVVALAASASHSPRAGKSELKTIEVSTASEISREPR